VQRRALVLALGVQVGAQADQVVDAVAVPLAGRFHEGGAAVLVRAVHVHSSVRQGGEGSEVVTAGRLAQRLLFRRLQRRLLLRLRCDGGGVLQQPHYLGLGAVFVRVRRRRCGESPGIVERGLTEGALEARVGPRLDERLRTTRVVVGGGPV